MKNILMKNGKLSGQALFDNILELDPANKAEYRSDSDLNNGRLFADIFKDYARFNADAKEWFIYNGIKWVKDPEQKTVERYAMALTDSLVKYSAPFDAAYIQNVAKLKNKPKRTNMIKDASSLYPVTYEDFNKDPFVFNCKNCVINLKTFKAESHRAGQMLSKVSNVVYDPDADPATFLKFLDDITLSDLDKIEYLQKVFGYALTGENTQEELYILYGATTRNGKSTLMSTIEYLFGDYGAHVQPETLAKQLRSTQSASGDIARLDGVRLAHMTEPPQDMIFNIALVKQMTGRDPVTARNVFEREFTYIPIFKLFINTNFLPKMTDTSMFLSGRVKIITFDRHFKQSEQDVNLKKKLKSQKSISAIFNWILTGLKAYQDAGEDLTPPQSIIDATNKYRDESDKTGMFVRECLKLCDGAYTTGQQAFYKYESWCRDNRFMPVGKIRFFEDLRRMQLLSNRVWINGKGEANIIKNYILIDS